MESKLANAIKTPQAQRGEAFSSILTNRLSNPSSSLPHDLGIFTTSIISDNVGPVVSQSALNELVKRLEVIKDADLKRNSIQSILAALSSRSVSYEEQISHLREELANLLEAEEEWTEAAKALQGIPLDSGQRALSEEFKLKIYMRIVRLYLEDDDAVSAEAAFKRASLLIHGTKDKELECEFFVPDIALDPRRNKIVTVGFKLSQARIFDSQRRFAEAASKYHDLSYSIELDEGDRLQALSAAVTCAILAPAGPQRSRILATLYRDDRSATLDSHAILAATFLEHIIRHQQIEEFAATLKPHQLAKLPPAPVTAAMAGQSGKRGPETVLDRAVMEHNLLSASKLYSNITLDGLGDLLSLAPLAAEAMARTMIQQGRLKASIDQVDNLITFEEIITDVEGATSNVAAAAANTEEADESNIALLAPHSARWDRAIRKASQTVEEVAARVESLLVTQVSA